MSLQFIVGNSGSGKSTYLYQQIIEESIADPDKNYLVIVPEQFTMQTQKEFVRLHPNHAIMNIDILSFERLAYRVFDELGTDTLTVLEETGKNLLLRRIAQDKSDELTVLKGNMKKKGYISEMKSLISELSQYHIGPEEFQMMQETRGMSETFRCKAADILVMYQGFLDEISGKYITTEALLELLVQVVAQSGLVKDAVMVFDGFTGFTPIQNQLMRCLFTLAQEIRVTVTCDVGEPLFGAYREEELFAMSKKMVRSLSDMAKDTGTALLAPVMMSREEPRRFVKGGCLEHLEQNLFRSHYHVYWKDPVEAEDAIELYSLADPRRELEFVAADICKNIRKSGYRYGDFAVVCANLEEYRFLAPRIFDTYGISCFVDTKTDIIFHPFTEFLSSLLQMVEERFSYESVFRFLRSGLMDLGTEEIDLLENYVLAARVRGWKKYDRAFMVMPRGYDAEMLVQLNEIREKFAVCLRPFLQEVQKTERTVTDISLALYQLVVSCDVERKLKQKAKQYETLGEETKAREYQQIYAIVMDLLDKMVSLLGEEQMTLKEYREILESGFEAARIGVIPPDQDCVMVGDIERSRLDHIKVLYLVGANDGSIPKSLGRGGILSQMERQQLKEASFELAPTDREKSFMQRFYLYLMVTKPSQRLVISYTRVSEGGSALRKSYFIGIIQKLFPKLSVTEIEKQDPADYMVSTAAMDGYIAENIREYALRDEPDHFREQQYLMAALHWYRQQNPKDYDKILSAAFYYHKEEPIGKAAMEALEGSVLTGSVTRLEQYARCAYGYFLTYGLGLSQRREYALEAMDMGNLYHEALETYSRLLEESEENWFDVSQERSDEILEQALRQTYQNLTKTEILEDARDTYVLKRMEKTLHRTVWALTKQIRKGKFEPKAFEVDFSAVGDLQSLEVTLDEMHRLRLKGKIDRMDLCETKDTVYVKIVDYKSGNRDFDLLSLYHGLQIQLVLYMGAAVEGVARQHPEKDVLPGAMFYYHIDDPLVDGGEPLDDAQMESAMLEQVKMRGIVNSSPEVVSALDGEFSGKSDVIPVSRKKDGSLTATSRVMSAEQFELMEDFVRHKIQKTGEKILKGEFSCQPYRLGQERGCTYCEFHSVCGFDSSLEGYDFRKLDNPGKQEAIFAAMQEELKQKGEETNGGEMDERSAEGN